MTQGPRKIFEFTPVVLVADEEQAFVSRLEQELTQRGFTVYTARDGEKAIAAIEEHKPSAVLLSATLPLISGFDVSRQLRRKLEFGNLPLLITAQHDSEEDRIRAFEHGADHFVIKSVSGHELSVRLRAALRRSQASGPEETLQFRDLELDPTTHTVTRAGRPLRLGPTEYRLLRFLMQKPGRVYTREQLLDGVWGRDIYVLVRTVDVHIRRLRSVLGDKAGANDYIRTVRSAGYGLNVSSGSSSARRVQRANGAYPGLPSRTETEIRVG